MKANVDIKDIYKDANGKMNNSIKDSLTSYKKFLFEITPPSDN